MMADMYRLATYPADSDKWTITHNDQKYVLACPLTEYSDNTKILIYTDTFRRVVLFADLDAYLQEKGVIIG